MEYKAGGEDPWVAVVLCDITTSPSLFEFLFCPLSTNMLDSFWWLLLKVSWRG